MFPSPRLAFLLLVLPLGSPSPHRARRARVIHPVVKPHTRAPAPLGPHLGAVGGNDHCTAESEICTAAQHAGVIKPGGSGDCGAGSGPAGPGKWDREPRHELGLWGL